MFLFLCRPFTVPQILRKGNKPELEQEVEDEEEEEPLQVLKSFQNGRSNITEKNNNIWPILKLSDEVLLSNINFIFFTGVAVYSYRITHACSFK